MHNIDFEILFYPFLLLTSGFMDIVFYGRLYGNNCLHIKYKLQHKIQNDIVSWKEAYPHQVQ